MFNTEHRPWIRAESDLIGIWLAADEISESTRNRHRCKSGSGRQPRGHRLAE
jgi:hypothetical protein